MLLWLLFCLVSAAQGTWLSKLAEAGLTRPAADKLIELGFSSADLYLNACPAADVLEVFLQHLLVTSNVVDGVTEATWRFHPVTAALRGLWTALHRADVPLPGAKAEESAAVMGLQLAERVAGKKLEATVRDKLRSAFLSAYVGELFCPLWDPSDSYLQLAWAMLEEKDYKWHPWRQIVSKASWMSLEAAKAAKVAEPDGTSALVRMLAKSQGLQDPDEVEVGASFFRVWCLLLTRMVAFAICKAAHLAGLRAYVNRFVELYTAKPLQSGRRGPSLAEAEAADQQVWLEIFRLMSSGCTMDDALNDVVVQRDLLANQLGSQIRELPAPPGKGKGAGGKGAGAKAYGKAAAGAAQRADPYAKAEPCRNFAAGKCNKGAACKFSHGPPGSF